MKNFLSADNLIKSFLCEGRAQTEASIQLGLKGIAKDSPVNYPDLDAEGGLIRSIEDWHSKISNTQGTKPLPFFDAFMKDRGHKLDTTHSHHELAGYDKVWEHPEISAHNKDMMSKENKYGKVGRGGHVLNTQFATLYKKREREGERSVGRPKYVYVQGRIGNTWQKGIH
jgi:hypothetical protein